MKLYNSLTRKKEEFTPLRDKAVGMYVCGPTVYDVGHLGHARSAVAFDLIRRYLVYRGYDVTFVSNITDVEDKMIKRAQLEGITEAQLAEKIIPEYAADYGALNVLPPDHQPRATQYIDQMVELIEQLLKKEIAYVADDGVYFRVDRSPTYGALSGQKLEELQSGARVEVDEKKENPLDFALWKKHKPGEPSWKGPAGMEGRPGWHIECSAMSTEILGETFDIHGGGIDLIFPHHEDEIAQAEMATGKPFARYWLHNGHIRVDSEKMSKSLGNFFTIKDILKKYHPAVVRYFLLSTHYRMPIDFSDELLEQAKNGLERIRGFARQLDSYKPDSAVGGTYCESIAEQEEAFRTAMDDDLNISAALAAIAEFIRSLNGAMSKGLLSEEEVRCARETFKRFDSVLGLLDILDSASSASAAELSDDEVQALLDERLTARASKDYARSDQLRDELNNKGIIIEDTSDGTSWKRAL